MDSEGDFVYVLRPRKENLSDRLLCQIRVVDNVKIVTIRSTYLVQNLNHYALELILIDPLGKRLQDVVRLGEV